VWHSLILLSLINFSPDKPFAEKQGFPGLVVHGPLLCLYLLDFVTEKQSNLELSQFTYFNKGPIFESDEFYLQGLQNPTDKFHYFLWVLSANRQVALQAEAHFTQESSKETVK